jgi:hypothetical protein
MERFLNLVYMVIKKNLGCQTIFRRLLKYLRKYSLTYDVHVYIHNLDFDMGKVAEYFSTNLSGHESLIINNRPAIMKTFYFTFHDSLQLLSNNSLDNLCRDFDVKNKKMDLVEKFRRSQRTENIYVGRRTEKEK